MTYDSTKLCLKDFMKEKAVHNCRPISCLLLIVKLLFGMIMDKMNGYLESEDALLDQQKNCSRGSQGTQNQLLIHKALLRDCKKRNDNLAIVWKYYRKASGLIPHSWIRE